MDLAAFVLILHSTFLVHLIYPSCCIICVDNLFFFYLRIDVVYSYFAPVLFFVQQIDRRRLLNQIVDHVFFVDLHLELDRGILLCAINVESNMISAVHCSLKSFVLTSNVNQLWLLLLQPLGLIGSFVFVPTLVACQSDQSVQIVRVCGPCLSFFVISGKFAKKYATRIIKIVNFRQV